MSALGKESIRVVAVPPGPVLFVLGFRHVRAHLEFWQDRLANNVLNSKNPELFGS